jgi:hypothetical protein
MGDIDLALSWCRRDFPIHARMDCRSVSNIRDGQRLSHQPGSVRLSAAEARWL